VKAKALICLASFFTANLVIAQPVAKESVAKQLQTYYEKGMPPPWVGAIKELAAEKAEKRGAAAKYLVSLLEQAQTDEFSGKAPWRATPFWGSRGENPARNLRQQIADELAKSQASSATLTVLRWYLDHERVARFQELAIGALDNTQGKEADEFCLRLLQPAHENSVVVLTALKQIGKRKSDVPDAVLKGLCDHYRPSIRDAARKLNKDRGDTDPGVFDPVAAMQRPALAALMTNIGALLDQPASPEAPFVKVTTTWSASKESESTTTLGWLIKNEGDSWIVLTPFGHRETFHKEKKANGRRNNETIVKSRWEKSPIAEEVKRVVELRKKGDPDFALSERGGLTGQFQGRGAGVYEVTLAHWLYTAKQPDLSAQLLLPALDSLYMDSHLVDMIRHRVGETSGYRMLVAFAGDRDFAETRRLADAIVQRYPGTRFHDYAVKLSKEMPKRQDDFKKLKLPTPEEWVTLKKKLSRAEQITFLAERVRLLNCFQWGQPGGYSISDVQYAEPSGMPRDASWGLGRGTTKVINPYVELVGGREGIFGDDEKKPFKGMELTVADIPLLAPFLRDDWHNLCVSFWRNFHPDRRLDTTRPMFASIINGLANKKICSAHEMERMNPAEKDKEIQRIVDWSRKNTTKSEGMLLLEGLEAEWKPGKVHWYWLKTRLTRLVELKEKGGVPLLHRHLDDLKTPAADVCWILSFGRQLDPESFKQKAEKLLSHENLSVQQQAALLLHATGDRKRSHEAFVRVLEKSRIAFVGELQTPEVLEALAKEDTAAARKVMARVFTNPRLVDLDWERALLLRMLAKAGFAESYRFYLPLLDVKGNKYGNHIYAEGVVFGEVIASEIVMHFAPNDPEIIRIVKMHSKAGDQIAPLKEWLKAKAKAVDKQPGK
jgi:hypothetical protein